jgi:hypothetical protein
MRGRNEMLKSEIDEIERLANRCLEFGNGIWEYRRYQCDETGRTVEYGGVYVEGDSRPLIFDASEYIEEFCGYVNPARSKKLIAYVRRLDETLECFYQHLDTFGTIAGGTRGEMDSQEKCFRLYHEVKALKEASDAQD